MGKRIVCLLLIISCLLLTGCGDSKSVISTDIDTYTRDCESVENASVLMPDLADLGAYTELKYTYQETTEGVIFTTRGLALFVKYDQETYNKQKADALSAHIFLEESVMDDEGDHYIIPCTEFEYKGYLMMIVPDDDFTFSPCKSFMMLGFNDETCVITYLYHYSQDLDFIAEKDQDLNAEMVSFVDRYFSWVDL